MDVKVFANKEHLFLIVIESILLHPLNPSYAVYCLLIDICATRFIDQACLGGTNVFCVTCMN